MSSGTGARGAPQPSHSHAHTSSAAGAGANAGEDGAEPYTEVWEGEGARREEEGEGDGGVRVEGEGGGRSPGEGGDRDEGDIGGMRSENGANEGDGGACPFPKDVDGKPGVDGGVGKRNDGEGGDRDGGCLGRGGYCAGDRHACTYPSKGLKRNTPQQHARRTAPPASRWHARRACAAPSPPCAARRASQTRRAAQAPAARARAPAPRPRRPRPRTAARDRDAQHAQPVRLRHGVCEIEGRHGLARDAPRAPIVLGFRLSTYSQPALLPRVAVLPSELTHSISRGKIPPDGHATTPVSTRKPAAHRPPLATRPSSMRLVPATMPTAIPDTSTSDVAGPARPECPGSGSAWGGSGFKFFRPEPEP
ncbi:hypothetical protein DFH09DRAFT_1087398 [Mycena vulgaris]|nr:hypothetical protein DFH09DRAFT_1087398 [Mycena vulgaris]